MFFLSFNGTFVETPELRPLLAPEPAPTTTTTTKPSSSVDQKRAGKKRKAADGKDSSFSPSGLDPDLIRCGVCKETILDAIFQCTNGHIYCGPCKTASMPKCPECRVSGSFSRNLRLEQVFANAILSCDACEKVQRPRHQLQKHSAFCASRPFQICDRIECQQAIFTVDDAVQHLEKKHAHFIDASNNTQKGGDEFVIKLVLKEGTKRIVRFGRLFVYFEWFKGHSTPTVFVRTVCSHPTHIVHLKFGTNLPAPKLETPADFKAARVNSRNWTTSNIPFVQSVETHLMATNVRIPLEDARKFAVSTMEQWVVTNRISSSSSSSASSTTQGPRTTSLWLLCEPCESCANGGEEEEPKTAGSDSSSAVSSNNSNSNSTVDDETGVPKAKRAKAEKK
jgi:hypothetical protein